MFRFTIRDMLWLTVVVAMAVTLLIERKQVVDATEALKLSESTRDGWRMVANDLASTLNQNGWTVTIGSDGRSWNVTPPAVPSRD